MNRGEELKCGANSGVIENRQPAGLHLWSCHGNKNGN